MSRELLTRAWAAGAGPGDAPLTIDLDSTICETYGLAKEGARHHSYAGQRGYHPLLAIAAETGDVLMSQPAVSYWPPIQPRSPAQTSDTVSRSSSSVLDPDGPQGQSFWSFHLHLSCTTNFGNRTLDSLLGPLLPNGHRRGTDEFIPSSCGEFGKCRALLIWERPPVFDELACPIQAIEPHVQLIKPQVVYRPLRSLPGFGRQPRYWDYLSRSGIVVKKAFWPVLRIGGTWVHIARVWPFGPLVVQVASAATENPVGPSVSQLGKAFQRSEVIDCGCPSTVIRFPQATPLAIPAHVAELMADAQRLA